MTIHATPADIARFRRYVDVLPCGCHFWTGARSRGRGNRKWYGSFWVGGRVVRAHRFAAEVLGGLPPLPPGHDRDHTCCFSLCVNPEHLEHVTKVENQRRKHARRAAAPVLLALLAILSIPAPTRAETGTASVDDGRPSRFDGVRHGGRASGGGRVDRRMAMAHPRLPMGSCAIVETGGGARARLLRVLDRGPCTTAHCRRTAPVSVRRRVADLWPRAAAALGCDGLCRVTVTPWPCGFPP